MFVQHKNGGKCDPGVWRAHKPDDYKSDELGAQREKEKNLKGEKKGKGKNLLCILNIFRHNISFTL